MDSSHSILSQRKADTSEVVNGCLVRSRIVLEHPPDVAKRLRKGISYGHSIVFERNLALWVLEFDVVSEIKHEDQLKYKHANGPQSWSFRVSLPQYQGAKETELLVCVGNEIGSDEIRTRVVSNAGEDELLVLELEIE